MKKLGPGLFLFDKRAFARYKHWLRTQINYANVKKVKAFLKDLSLRDKDA